MKIFFTIIFIIFSNNVFSDFVEKNVIDKPLKIPVPDGMVPICESNHNYWTYIRQGLLDTHHILTCLIDRKTVNADLKNSAEITLLVLIQKQSITQDISLKQFSRFKKGALDYHEKNKEEISELNGEKLIISRANPEILSETENELLIFESTSGTVNGESVGGVNWIRAIVYVKKRPIELRIGSKDTSKYSKEKLIKLGKKWKKSFINENT